MSNTTDPTAMLSEFAEKVLTADWSGFEDDAETTYTYVGSGALTVPSANGVSPSRIIERGDTITVTAALIEVTKDRTGFSWAANLATDPRFEPGEPSATIRAERDAAAAAAAEKRRLDEVRINHAFARRVEAAAQARAQLILDARFEQTSREF